MAQLDSINYLEEVLLSDMRLHEYSEGLKVEKLNDSVLEKNQMDLTTLLRFNSNIYLKENGPGMVASPSFRGTNASHTAVVWNGININSQLNGQTDFNTIYSNNYDNISVRSGGGSVLYGSGAIGGSVHLNNRFRFTDHFENKLRLVYGSFETKKAQLNTSFGNESLNISAGLNYVSSDNNYRYLGTNRFNDNGEFENLNLNLNAGTFFNQKNLLKFYHNTFFGDRNFSGGLHLNGRDRYEDRNSRSLLEWQYRQGQIRSTVRFAQVYEHYKYFQNASSETFSFGKTNKLLAQYDFKFDFSKTININAVAEYSSTKGDGSDISDVNRNVFAGVLLLNHQLTKKFGYGLQLRQEFANDYESPLLFAADVVYAFSEAYALKLNASKNFRMPTFNDIYWQPRGNPNLKPETSWQAEIGQEITVAEFDLNLNAFFIKSEDMIVWVPQGSLSSPQNINKFNGYGGEAGLGYYTEFGKNKISLNVDYAYTVSENAETKKQLMYVPFHKLTASTAYSYKNFTAFYQFLRNGNVFTTTDESRGLKGYDISNFGLSYNFSELIKKAELEVSLRLNNIYNEKYQITAGRPMPPRNFQIQLNINI